MPINKAVFIGINYKGTTNSLRGCYNDVTSMANFLEKNYDVQQAMILTDENEDYNKPTRRHIIQAISWLANGAKKGDCLFFHYSGHGSQVKAVDDIYEKDHMDETICPLDYATNGMITDGELRYYLVDALPAGCKLTCVLDCCHSGTGLDLKYVLSKEKCANNLLVHDQNFEIEFLNKIVKLNEFFLEDCGYSDNNADVVMISGCMSSQTSADTYINNKSCGAMTFSFIESMKSSIGNNYKLTFVDLLNDMTNLLKDDYEQRPQIHFSKNINIYDFFQPNLETTYDNLTINHKMPKEFVKYDNDASINGNNCENKVNKPKPNLIPNPYPFMNKLINKPRIHKRNRLLNKKN